MENEEQQTEVTPEQTPQEPTIHVQEKKTFNWFVLAVAIAVVVVVVFGYFIFRSIPSSVETDEMTRNITTDVGNIAEADPTADWKAYRNEKYGFSFKYPKSMNISQDKDGRIIFFDPKEMILIIDREFDVADQITTQLKVQYCSEGNRIDDSPNNPYIKEGRFSGQSIGTYSIDNHRTDVSYIGCYECYGIDDAEDEYRKNTVDLVSSITCNNTNTACLRLSTRNLKDKYNTSQYLLENILQTITFDPSFDDIQCTVRTGKG